MGSPVKIDIVLKGAEQRQIVEIPTSQEGKTEKLPLYIENEAVVGTVSISLDSGKKLEHQGITVALVGATSEYSNYSLSI